MSGTSLIPWYYKKYPGTHNQKFQVLVLALPQDFSPVILSPWASLFSTVKCCWYPLMFTVHRLRSGSNEECKSDSCLDMARGHLGKNKYLACHIPKFNQTYFGAWKHLAQLIRLTETSMYFQDLALGPGSCRQPLNPERLAGARARCVGEGGHRRFKCLSLQRRNFGERAIYPTLRAPGGGTAQPQRGVAQSWRRGRTSA